MLKILFIPTGNVFTLPDEEVLRIKAQDRANEYRILDAGCAEEGNEQLTQEGVEEAVAQAEERVEEIEEEDAEEEKRIEELEAEPQKGTLNLDKYNKAELVGWLKRFGIPANKNQSKEVLIQKCIDAGINI